MESPRKRPAQMFPRILPSPPPPSPNLTSPLQLFHYAQIMYALSIVPLKAAIILQCLRVFVPDGIRDSTFWISHLLLWANTIFYITVIFVETFSCSPRAAIWDVTIKGKCLNRLSLHYIS